MNKIKKTSLDFFEKKTSYNKRTSLFEDKSIDKNKLTASNISKFSNKWKKFYTTKNRENYDIFQEKWFRSLYGISRKKLLSTKGNLNVLDAGCGGGDKTHEMAKINDKNNLWGVDLSHELEVKSLETKNQQNLNYLRADISNLPFKKNIFDIIICDQVLHHTFSPKKTLKEFKRLLRPKGTLLTYVYRKKSLPRELLDQHFIDSKAYSQSELFEMSKQLTKLGKTLEEFSNEKIWFPEIPILGIKRQKKTMQRFIYDNFIKCFYNEDIGIEQSNIVNFDWYIPDIAYRYDEDTFFELCKNTGFKIIYKHIENSCISVRLERNP
tara:strand:+ start:4955 stop:5923 length:969 start_codon:yes stop_codon:yes gene_type:complete